MKTESKREKVYSFLDRFLVFLLYAMIFAIPVSNALIEVFFSIACLLFFIKKIIRPDFKFCKNSIFVFLSFFILFCALSLINSGFYFGKSLKVFLSKWLESFFIFSMFADTFLNNPKRLRKAILFLLLAGGIILVDSIIQYFSTRDFLRHRFLMNNRITACFKHFNSLGAYLAPVSLFFVGFSFEGRFQKRYRIVSMVFLLLCCICLALVDSRGAWLSFFSGVFLFILVSKKYKLVFLPITMLLIFIFVPAFQQRICVAFEPGVDANRFLIFSSIWPMILEKPFLGGGVGTFTNYFFYYAPDQLRVLEGGIPYAHNCFLQIWAETGVFSLISFLIFLSLLIYRGVKSYERKKELPVLALTCALFGFIIHSFFDVHFYSLQLSSFFWAVSGLVCASLLSDKKIDFPFLMKKTKT